MYLDFYDLKEEPFNLTPDTDFIFPSSQYSKAINHLLYGVERKKGFILITGEVGAGKTTLCRSLLRKLDTENIEIAIILNSFLSEMELLRAINRDLGLRGNGRTKEELIEELNIFLLHQKEQDKTVVLVVDECQNLTFPVLEQIRMLSNLETEKDKLLQIILIGQPEFLEMIASNELRQLNQRITVRYHIEPLTLEELEKYIYHRIKVASKYQPSVFLSSGALKKIYSYSKGIPRLTNVLGDYVLMSGFVHDTHHITAKMVEEAIAELKGKSYKSKTNKIEVPYRQIALTVFGVLLIMLIIAFRGIFFHLFVMANNKVNDFFASKDPAQVERVAPVSREEVYIPPVVEEKKAVDALPEKEVLKTTSVLAVVDQKEELISRAVAGVELLKKWNVDEGAAVAYYTAGDTGKSFLESASHFGFLAVEVWTDILLLNQLDMPCAVKLKNQEWALLFALSTNEASMVLPEGVKTFSVKDFEEVFSGQTVFFCPKDSFSDKILYKGNKGEAVVSLQEKLWKLGFFKGDFSGIYDAETEEAVKAFQEKYGIVADGIAGKETFLLLYRFFTDDNVPFLQV